MLMSDKELLDVRIVAEQMNALPWKVHLQAAMDLVLTEKVTHAGEEWKVGEAVLRGVGTTTPWCTCSTQFCLHHTAAEMGHRIELRQGKGVFAMEKEEQPVNEQPEVLSPWETMLLEVLGRAKEAMPQHAETLESLYDELRSWSPLSCTPERFTLADLAGEECVFMAKCLCDEAREVSGHWCKHRLAYALGKRAMEALSVQPQTSAAVEQQPVVAMQRTIAEISHTLAQPLPERFVAVRQQDGRDIRYLHWHTLAYALDAIAPGWECSVVREHLSDTIAHCVVELRLHGADATRIFRAAGSDAQRLNRKGEVIEGYGSLLERAERTAFRRACALAGLGRWLYIGDDAGRYAQQYFAKR